MLQLLDKIVERFCYLLEKSVVTSGLIAIVVVGVMCYCVLQGIEVPESLYAAFYIIIGFFFADKAGKASFDQQLKKAKEDHLNSIS